MLAQRLADTLDDAAMRLPIDQQRVDDSAEVIDKRIAHYLDRAGIGIYFDFGDVAAIRKRGGRSVGNELHIEALRQLRRQAHARSNLFG